MSSIINTIGLSLIFILLISGKEDSTTIFSLSKKEIMLYDSINNYRAEKGLHKISLSLKLSKVAQIHCEDLEENYKLSKVCNLHSWSATSTKWKSCCYTSNHEKAACMWDKPKELTGYKSAGYEIAYYSSNAFSSYHPLERWKSSKKGHNKVIMNKGQWSKVNWEAIGIGLTEHYACVWFGSITDSPKVDVKE
jgi:hypothetical protein